MNTQMKPIELTNANAAVDEGWDKYDAAIEKHDSVEAQALWQALTYLEENQGSQYHQWQILGGTSDIESIALAGLVDTTQPTSIGDGQSWTQITSSAAELARRKTAREIALDENGNLRPYSSFMNRSGAIADDHEIHSYTVDGS